MAPVEVPTATSTSVLALPPILVNKYSTRPAAIPVTAATPASNQSPPKKITAQVATRARE